MVRILTRTAVEAPDDEPMVTVARAWGRGRVCPTTLQVFTEEAL